MAILSMTLAERTPLLAHGALHDRIAELKTQLAARPADPGVLLQLADVCCQHEDWTEAAAAIEALDVFAPGDLAQELFRGEMFLGTRRFEDARRALDRVLVAKPENTRALLARARLHRALEQTEASLADYRAALRSASSLNRDVAQEVADVLTLAGQYDEALRLLMRAQEKLGAFPSLVARALELEIKLGRFDAALARIDLLQSSAPRPEPWMARRASLLIEAGRLTEGRARWEALLAHIETLPNLERGSATIAPLAEQARAALRVFHVSSAPQTATRATSPALPTTEFSASSASHP